MILKFFKRKPLPVTPKSTPYKSPDPDKLGGGGDPAPGYRWCITPGVASALLTVDLEKYATGGWKRVHREYVWKEEDPDVVVPKIKKRMWEQHQKATKFLTK